MSDKDTKNPFEEIQKQLQELLKTNNPNLTVNPFTPQKESPPPASAQEEGADDNEIIKRIRAFNRKPK